MSTNAADARLHVDVLEAATGLTMFEYGKVPGEKDPAGVTNPGTAPTRYGLVQVERIGRPAATMNARTRKTSWRASLRAVGKYTPDNCRSAMALLLALENQRLVIDGHISTPVYVEDTEDARPDGNAFSALIRFTYTL